MKILELLYLDKKSLDEKKASRKAKAMKRGQESLVDKLEAEKDALLDKKESLLILDVEKTDENTWNVAFQQVQLDLLRKEKELQVCRQTLLEYFTSDTK
jgi:hypothetical protein